MAIEFDTKQDFMAITSIPDVLAYYTSLMTSIKYAVSEMSKLHENAECNKEICSIMMELVKTAESEMNLMMINMDNNMKNFIQSSYYLRFKRFKIIISNIKEYVKNVSTFRGYKKYIDAKEAKSKFEKLIKEYEKCIENLQFTHFTLKAVDKMNSYSYIGKVEKDLKEVEETLQNITCNDNRNIDVTVQEISIIRIQTAKQHSDVRAQRINSSELKDPLVSLENHHHHRGRIVKKLYNDFEVACKPIGDYKNQESELSILGKLQSQYILRFYGLSTVDNLKVIVIEWTNNGTLKELYNTYIIPWTRKLQIVQDICRGIVLLRRLNIFHQDLRCGNIFITNDFVPKLGNFRCTREVNVRAKNLSGLVTDIIRWMAPEQLERYERYRRDENTYTFSCEMFSFGMLIWELCYEKLPYENLEIKEISDHVLCGKREKLSLKNYSNPIDKEIQQEFVKIINKTWHHKPQQRISLASLHLTFEELVKKYPIPPDIPIPLQEKTSKLEEAMDIDSPPVDFLVPLEKGVEFHKNRDHKAALKCFEGNANLGDPLAKYWLGYYLSYGYEVIEINKERAKILFKEAADHDHSDAQCRYAVALLSDLKKEDPEDKKVENRNEIIHYFKLAANNKNPNAMYYLADIYIHGKLKVQSNEELGMMYLKLAADYNYEKAVNLLKQLNDAKNNAKNDAKIDAKNDAKNDVKNEVQNDVKIDAKNDAKNDVKNDKNDIKNDVNDEAINEVANGVINKVANNEVMNDKVESDKVKNEIKNEIMNEDKNEAMNEVKSEVKSEGTNGDKNEDKSEKKSEGVNEDRSGEKSEAMNEDKSEEKSEAVNEDKSKIEMIIDNTSEAINGDKIKVINKNTINVMNEDMNEIMNEDKNEVMSIDKNEDNCEVMNVDNNEAINEVKNEKMNEDKSKVVDENINEDMNEDINEVKADILQSVMNKE
ncbi:18264_t:CDS:2 [Gigaspora margarita]|uniref:18264_t:CDS:1 n=1 Tax=Gigaspora margarita TaxID=4874 RepID=A0ABN7VB79_GIGMA|nr:18264_t:CDS:2 [Gigaspora margarita]